MFLFSVAVTVTLPGPERQSLAALPQLIAASSLSDPREGPVQNAAVEGDLVKITVKRVYDAVSTSDGTRLLVERLWPRGVKKTSLRVDGWLKDVAPSTELRQWFSHDPTKWNEFRRRYFEQLSASPDTWSPIIEAARHGAVTLIYSSHDTEHNNAVALQEFINAHSST